MSKTTCFLCDAHVWTHTCFEGMVKYDLKETSHSGDPALCLQWRFLLCAMQEAWRFFLRHHFVLTVKHSQKKWQLWDVVLTLVYTYQQWFKVQYIPYQHWFSDQKQYVNRWCCHSWRLMILKLPCIFFLSFVLPKSWFSSQVDVVRSSLSGWRKQCNGWECNVWFTILKDGG